MPAFAQPVVVVSRCLGFCPTRYNGAVIDDAFVEQLGAYVRYRTVCPEVQIGLGVPRQPLRLVREGDTTILVQPATERDATVEMERFSGAFLSGLGVVDGFILKNRSPSCGTGDVRTYRPADGAPIGSKAGGIFGAQVLARYGHLPIEDEGRLRNARIREHFLTRLFTLTSFRALRLEATMSDLVRFQAQNKLLLMAYHQSEMRLLGRIVANRDALPLAEVLDAYQGHLYRALARPPRVGANINVLLHAFGYFHELNSEEKAFFLDLLEKYRAGRIPLATILTVLRSWIVRFDEGYLRQQTYLEPYPERLMEGADAADPAKEYWP